MNGSDFVSCVRYTVSLVRRNTVFWALFVPVFFAGLNALTLVPYVGYVLRQAVFAVMGTQVIVMLSEVAAGGRPRLRTLCGAFDLPASSGVLLVGVALAPFFVGIAVLAAGDTSGTLVRYFFGNVFWMRPPDVEDVFKLNVVMQIAGAPFAFVGYFVGVRRDSPRGAWRRAFALACDNSHILAGFLAADLALEYAADFEAASALTDAIVTLAFLILGFFQIALAFTIPVLHRENELDAS